MNTTRFSLYALLYALLALLCVAAPAHAKVKRHTPKRPAGPGSPPVRTVTPPGKSVDIGKVGVPGTTTLLDAGGSVLRVTASGEDIFGKADSFHSVYQPLFGDGQIVARIVSYERRDQWTKVGVMVRQSNTPGAKFADVVLTPDHGAEFQWRADADADAQTSDQTPAPAPYWVKLTRTGDVFVGSISPDGKVWTERGRATVPMTADVLAGVCVTSHKNDEATAANLDGVRVTPAARAGGR